jgi:hypothetical protein
MGVPKEYLLVNGINALLNKWTRRNIISWLMEIMPC